MSDNKHHNITVSFKDLNLDSFYTSASKIAEVFEAKLYVLDEQIRLDVYFNIDCALGRKFGMWLQDIDHIRAGRFIKFESSAERHLNRIDFSDYSIFAVHSPFIGDSNKVQVMKIYLDGVKFYWQSQKIFDNCAYFYFDDNAFHLISEYYPRFDTITGEENKFHLSRMEGTECEYQFGPISFKPQFNVDFKDDRANREISLIKKPLLKISFNNDISELEIRQYAESIKLLASFYSHKNIEFLWTKIFKGDDEIAEKRFQKKFVSNHDLGLRYWGVNLDFHKLMTTQWQTHFSENKELLEKIIPLFNQSNIVDANSSLLIRYSILETCISYYNKKKGKSTKKEFSFNDDKNQLWEEAFEKLQSSVIDTEKADFKKRWGDIQANLKKKPMRSELNSYISDLQIDLSDFPIQMKDIKTMRNDLSHGSIESINENSVKQANLLLFGIIGIIILKSLGINDFDLITITDRAKTIK